MGSSALAFCLGRARGCGVVVWGLALLGGDLVADFGEGGGGGEAFEEGVSGIELYGVAVARAAEVLEVDGVGAGGGPSLPEASLGATSGWRLQGAREDTLHIIFVVNL